MRVFRVGGYCSSAFLSLLFQVVSECQVPQTVASVCQAMQDAMKGTVVRRYVSGVIQQGGHGWWLADSKESFVDITGVRVPCELFIEFGENRRRNQLIQEKLDRIRTVTAGIPGGQLKGVFAEVLAIVESDSRRAISSTSKDERTRAGYGAQGTFAGRIVLLDVGRVTIEFRSIE